MSTYTIVPSRVILCPGLYIFVWQIFSYLAIALCILEIIQHCLFLLMANWQIVVWPFKTYIVSLYVIRWAICIVLIAMMDKKHRWMPSILYNIVCSALDCYKWRFLLLALHDISGIRYGVTSVRKDEPQSVPGSHQ